MKKLHFLVPILVMFILMSFDAFGKDKDSQPEFSAEVAQEETTYGLGILETASPKRTSSPSSMDKFDINQTIVRTGGKKPHIIAYFHADGTDFSGKIKAGLKEVSRDLGLEMDFRAPRPFNMKKYRELLIAGINETPDGIVVTNPNAEAMNPLINEAVKKGIPVITYNTENPGAKRLAFYGQNLENSGRIMGEKLAELMKGKGKILILSSLSEASWSQAREKGLRLALKQHPDIRQTPSITTGAFMPGLREVLKKQLEMHKDVTAIACLGGNGRHVGNLL
ncbi:MAG: substrate-binding domain-containing protein [Candidatus Sedimenticola sp. (ex Thyasira tokunagai)]